MQLQSMSKPVHAGMSKNTEAACISLPSCLTEESVGTSGTYSSLQSQSCLLVIGGAGNDHLLDVLCLPAVCCLTVPDTLAARYAMWTRVFLWVQGDGTEVLLCYGTQRPSH